MKATEEILKDAGNVFVKRLQEQFDAKGLNDTGQARNSLSSSVSGKTLKIDGLLRTVVLVTGRVPGKFPPMEPIRAWVRRKLVVAEEEVESVAFLIARKIARSGTDIFTDRAKGLQIQLIIDELNEELFKDISNQMAFEVTESVFEAFK